MSTYLVSFGDSNKYAVDFPGSLDEFKNSDIVKGLMDKVDSFVKDKFALGNIENIIPVHVEEVKDATGYEKFDMSKISDIIKNTVKQVGVQNLTDKLNLNAPFDKL